MDEDSWSFILNWKLVGKASMRGARYDIEIL